MQSDIDTIIAALKLTHCTVQLNNFIRLKQKNNLWKALKHSNIVTYQTPSSGIILLRKSVIVHQNGFVNLTLSSQRSAARVSFRACADAGLLRAIGTKYSPVTDSRWGDVATYSYTEEKIRNTKLVIDLHIKIGLQYRSTVDSANKAIIT